MKKSLILLTLFFIIISFSGSPKDYNAADKTGTKVGPESVIKYLLSHQKQNGAFGPAGHDHTDLAWNYPAVHSLILLSQKIPRAEDCFRNGFGAIYKQPGSHNANWAWDIYQRGHLAAVLGRKGEDGIGLNDEWKLEFQDREAKFYFSISGKKLESRIAPFCDIPTLVNFVEAIKVSGGKVLNPEIARDFLLQRQTESGAFSDAHAINDVTEANAHIIATAQAIFCLQALGYEIPRKEGCIKWLQSCQASSGGFRWSPLNASHSNKSDVWYTWAAARGLAALNSRPLKQKDCIKWINSLQNEDGGFGDRPGWNSRLYSTYYAIHALDVLTGDPARNISKKVIMSQEKKIEEGKYKIFQAQLKTPPGGGEMVEMVVKMGLNFLGVKDNSPGTTKISTLSARQYALERGYNLEVVSCPEQYGYNIKRFGGHPSNHVANFIIPPDIDPAELSAFNKAGNSNLTWDEFSKQIIKPLKEKGTLFYPEMDYEMANAYMVYDEGLDGGPGYNAIIGGLGWPVWDWIRFFPYRERWVGKLAVLVDADAHGDLIKWGEPLERQRMLYLSGRHDLSGFLEACSEGRTVCVIRGGRDKSEIAFYGDEAVIDYVKSHQQDWQWWK